MINPHQIPHSSTEPTSITVNWVLRLRWGAITSQLVLISLLWLFQKTDIPMLLAAAIIGFEVISNFLFILLKSRHKYIPDLLLYFVMFFDIVLLSILLSETGGAMNPFTFLFLLHVVVGAILLRPLVAWSLGIFTILCYSSFFITYDDFIMFFKSILFMTHPSSSSASSPLMISCGTDPDMKLHLQGMLVAFAITTVFLVFFIGRIREALKGYYNTIEQLKAERAKSEKLGALATLAAGAAHEFSTPLSTIAVAAGEMLYFCKKQGGHDELLEDITLIQSQVGNCKEILDGLSADAGTHRGEPLTEFSINDLIAKINEKYDKILNPDIIFTQQINNLTIKAPFLTLVRLTACLIKNSIDATIESSKNQITVDFDYAAPLFIITVVDQGSGMDEAVLSQATEPFYTTKAPGRGMGLGLFLARSVAESFDGKLIINSELNKGTKIIVSFAFERIGK